tara:strand:+ start:426 stop:890 length:465 start_codon:yes stop_codon:yes gene_type:complete
MFENIERNYEKLKKDIKPHGLTNIIIFAAITITSYGWLGNFGIFDGFNNFHHVLWLSLIIGQVGYIIYTMLLDQQERTKMGKEIYKLFTDGGIEPLRNIIIISDEEPLFEAFLIFVALIIPFPFNVEMSHKYKIILGLSKIGFYHLVAALIKHH